MRDNVAPRGKRSGNRWLRRHGFALHLLTCFVLVSASSCLIEIFEKWRPDANMFWVANGVLLAYLLLAPRWRWPAYLGVGLVAISVRILFLPVRWHEFLLYGLMDVVEVALAAQLLRPQSKDLPRFSERGYLVRFLLYAGLAGPAVAAALYVLLYPGLNIPAPPHPFLSWMASDSPGMVIGAPAFIAMFQTRFREAVNWRRSWIFPVLLLLVAMATFLQSTVPLVFLIYPLLVLVVLRLGMGHASLFMLITAVIASWFTIRGSGPFAAVKAINPALPTVLLLLAVGAAMLMIYSVAVVLESQRATERRLKEIVRLHTLVAENSRDVIIVADFEGNRQFVSSAAESVTGWNTEEFAKRRIFDLIHPEDRARAEAAVERIRAGSEGVVVEGRLRKNTGEYIWAESSLRPIRDAGKATPTGILNIMRDVTDRKRSEEAREFQHSLIRAIRDVSLDGILVVNAEGDVVSVNRRFAEVWNVSTDLGGPLEQEETVGPDHELLSRVLTRVRDPESFLRRVKELYADPDKDDHCEIELRDGRTLERYSTGLRSESGHYLGRVWFFSDITERKRAAQQLADAYKEVEELSAQDALTGLANRRRFDARLAIEWRRAIRDGKPLSLMLVDVDHFKSYNDTYGHLSGDECLKQIAASSLNVAKRPGDLVARYGGDEFTIIMADTERDGALQLGNAICALVEQCRLPHESSATGIVTVSVGCATMVPNVGESQAALIELADRALYVAKRSGRNRATDQMTVAN